ncbi:3-deoxy-D-manno-octulosonic acid transferase, partial [Candidatus Omnitrophota bacterium]
ILSAHKQNVPICIINGRLSPRSFWRYYYFRRLIKPIVQMVDYAAVQTERYKSRFLRIGFRKDRVVMTGTMKYDIENEMMNNSLSRDDFYALCGFSHDAKILIAASTHDGEESQCLDAYVHLKKEFPGMCLIIAPRHINRTKDIISLVEEKGFTYRVADQGQCNAKESRSHTDVFILNTMGQLASLYQYCDYIFMGGSLIRHGGQNPLEAVMFSKPIISGPYYYNFQDVYTDLVNVGGAYIVRSPDELLVVIKELIADKDKARIMGEHAFSLLQSKQGATQRNRELIVSLVKDKV